MKLHVSMALALSVALAFCAYGQDTSGTRGTTARTQTHVLSGKTYALLIGISRYQSVRSLAYADQDAQLVSDFLTSPLGGVDPKNISMLLNERATRAAIDDEVKNFVKRNASPDNSLIVFVAGHGVYLKTEIDPVSGKPMDSSPYILTYDSNTNDPKTTGYPMDEFRAMIAGQTGKYGRVMAYIDVCHAANIAGIGGGSELQKGVGAAFQGLGGDLGLMVASSANKYAFESPFFGGGHGAFSYFLVSGLNGSAVSSPSDTLSWGDLADYVKAQVKSYTDKKQRPADYASDDAFVLISDFHKTGIVIPPAQPLPKQEQERESRNRQVYIAPVVAARSVTTRAENDILSAAVARGALLPEDFGGASQIASQLPAGTQERQMADRRVRVAMEDEGQQIVSRYLEGDQIPQVRQDFFRCSRLFEEAFRLDPSAAFDHSRALFCHGRALIFGHSYRQAEELLRQSIQIDPKRSYAWNAIGISKLEQISRTRSADDARMLFDQAADAFRTAIAYAPYWAYPRHNFALTLSERGDFDGAIKTYRVAIDIAPQYSYLPYNLGLLYTRMGDLEEARTWFDAALKTAIAFPRKQDGRWAEKAEPLNALGTLALQRHDEKAARGYFAEAVAEDPKNPSARQNLALLAASDKDYPLADRLWGSLTHDSPDYIAARIAWAESLNKRGDTASAIVQYQDILVRQADWTGGHEVLAGLYLSSGDTGRALAEVNAALGTTPSSPSLLELRGDIDARQHRVAEALTDWRAALALAPDKNVAARIRQKLKRF